MAPITKSNLLERAQAVAEEFEYTPEQVNAGVAEFLHLMDAGLQLDNQPMTMIPTYVTSVPNGTEKGVYLAVDLGGTNFRVCSITLNGDSTFELVQAKSAIPKELMIGTAHELFSFLAERISDFVKEHHAEHFDEDNEHHLRLGFTFSFPVDQKGINKGFLIRWTKGFDIKDAIGKDVCALLQKEIDALELPVVVAALVNDTVGTLMARSYTSPGETGTLLGAIFGTGTNGAYVEKLRNLKKLTATEEAKEAYGVYDKSTGEMVVNTEWGSFDNAMKVLPDTRYDRALDANSVNPGIQMFEKRISGMFLGEILRNALLYLRDEAGLFASTDSNTVRIKEGASIYTPWSIDTAFLSNIEADITTELTAAKALIAKELGVSGATLEEAQAVKLVARAIGRRSARLSAVPIAAIIIATKLRQEQKIDEATVLSGTAEESIIDLGVDGSVVEYYPNFEKYLREALIEVKEIGTRVEKRVRIGVAKDGSGVGAALIALVASL
ncbi:hexokinase-domain-containing protein [Peziza echinospora]|nr:hexokinase-domain-containing protein [Peziza echinospora]